MFTISKTLRKDVFEDMPENASNLTKAAHIYKQLCSRLEYSMDFFLDEDRVADWYTNPDNLKYVDGRDNNQVVCFTFNAIFAQLLIDSGACYPDLFERENFLTSAGKFARVHSTLMLLVDDHLFEVDSTDGVLNRCDLTLTKFGECSFMGWQPLGPTDAEQQDAKTALKQARREVFGPEDMLRQLSYDYITSKGSEFAKMPLQERFDLFMGYLKHTPPYSLESFTFMLKLKHALFTRAEVGQQGPVRNFEMSFVKDADTKEYKAVILYNPEGYVDDAGFENYNTLQIYEFSAQDRTITTGIEPVDLAMKIASEQYVEPKDMHARQIKMIQPGTPQITPVAPEGETLEYDEQQNPINVDHYERTEKLTGRTYVCDEFGRELSKIKTSDSTPVEV